MSTRTATALLALGTLQATAPRELSDCIAPAAAIRLDHVVVVVRNLDTATSRLAQLGFRFKPGRLHPDSILNRHIKFRDGTEIELMTLAGAPTSQMARDYATLLAAGEGGAYAALWTTEMGGVRSAASGLGEPRLTRSGAWEFLSLPDVLDTHAVFFGAGGLSAYDPDSALAHPNEVRGLAAVWLEGGPLLDSLLTALGARSCGPVTLAGGPKGTRWALSRGTIVVVRGSGQRVLGVELTRDRPGPAEVREPFPGFWILLR